MNNIAIFCGSKFGNNPNFLEETIDLCKALGKAKKHILYGGGTVGLMGTVANTVLQYGGTVTGIIPTFLNYLENEHQGLTELIVTETMHQRKQLLFEKSEAAIILPGGFGTLDELFELLTWNQLELHKIKVIILNVDGFYDHIKSHIEKMHNEQFLYINPNDNINFITKGKEIINNL